MHFFTLVMVLFCLTISSYAAQVSPLERTLQDRTYQPLQNAVVCITPYVNNNASTIIAQPNTASLALDGPNHTHGQKLSKRKLRKKPKGARQENAHFA